MHNALFPYQHGIWKHLSFESHDARLAVMIEPHGWSERGWTGLRQGLRCGAPSEAHVEAVIVWHRRQDLYPDLLISVRSHTDCVRWWSLFTFQKPHRWWFFFFSVPQAPVMGPLLFIFSYKWSSSSTQSIYISTSCCLFLVYCWIYRSIHCTVMSRQPHWYLNLDWEPTQSHEPAL